MCIRVGFHAALDFRDIFRIIERNSLQAQRPVEKVNMAVGEAGQHESAGGIQHFGGRAAVAVELAFRADRDDLVAPNGNGFSPRLFAIHRIDSSVRNENVGSSRRPLRGCPRAHNQKPANHSSKQTNANLASPAAQVPSFDPEIVFSTQTANLKRGWSIHPQHPALAASRVLPAMGGRALKVKAVPGLEAELLLIDCEVPFASYHQQE